MSARPTLRCLPGGLADRLPPALLSLASGAHEARGHIGHDDRMALASLLLAAVDRGEVSPTVGLWLADQMLARRPPE